MTSQYRPGLIYCEMVKMDALVRHDPHTYRLLDYEGDMHPIGAQLCGSKPRLAGTCARIIEELGFDVIDLNCGCPVDKVTKDGSGSGLLKNPTLIGEILANMVAAVNIPVTVKIRAGWDETHEVAVEITKIAEQAGATAICIHGRTRAQGYKGAANWDHIKNCKEIAKHILVIGNGDVSDVKSARNMFEYTGCDAILLARGTMGQPWLIRDIYDFYEGKAVQEASALHFRDAMLEHFAHILTYQLPRKAVLDMRRIGCWYLRKGRGVKPLREALNKCKNVDEIRPLILSFPWQEVEFCTAQEEEEVCEEC